MSLSCNRNVKYVDRFYRSRNNLCNKNSFSRLKSPCARKSFKTREGENIDRKLKRNLKFKFSPRLSTIILIKGWKKIRKGKIHDKLTKLHRFLLLLLDIQSLTEKRTNTANSTGQSVVNSPPAISLPPKKSVFFSKRPRHFLLGLGWKSSVETLKTIL